VVNCGLDGGWKGHGDARLLGKAEKDGCVVEGGGGGQPKGFNAASYHFSVS
jgi:hypothetical protein